MTSDPAVPAGTRPSSGADLRLRGVTRRYGRFRAVDGLDLDVGAGEFVTLLGPSGSGKTTALMIVAGFEVPDAGTVAIGGREVGRLPPHRRNIGMVFQSYALFPHMTVAENVAFPLRQRGIDRAEVARRTGEALALVRLPGFGGRYPQQLSGGQQQRVAIARAVVFDPPVLLMDEPLSALDKQLREEMQLEIKGLHARLGITFVYVTHDQREALVMSDRVAVMNGGRLEQIDAPLALYDAPANRFVASFVGEANFLAAEPRGTDGAGCRVLGLGDGLHVRAPGGADPDGGGVTCMIRPEKIEVLRGAPAGSERPGRNALPATVREAVFMGEAVRYVLLVGGRHLVAAKSQHRAGAPVLAPGEAVTIEWAVADTRLL